MYPMHVLFLFTFLIIEFLKLYLENEYNIIANNKSFTINDGSAFIFYLLLLNIFNNILHITYQRGLFLGIHNFHFIWLIMSFHKK